MNILFGLTYYRPHVSGLTMYVQRIAEALSARGHQVTVLTSRYDASLPRREMINGVMIRRVPVALRVSKGVLMPRYPLEAWRILQDHDVAVLNLPNTPIESLMLPVVARLAKCPIIGIYHSDVTLPEGLFNRIVDEVVFASNYTAATLLERISAYTEDFANHSRILRRFKPKITVIPPPVQVEDATPEAVAAFKAQHAPNGEKLVGFTARFATEKGVEYMLEALDIIHRQRQDVKVLFAGEYQNVIGEDAYWQRLQPLLQRYHAHWTFLGLMNNTQLASYYRACDLTVLPSINSTETFGLVQVESMLCGTPVVASNLPGVRQPITMTGMGEIVPTRDAEALAAAVLRVIDAPERYIKPRSFIEEIFGMERTVDAYERLLGGLARTRQ